MADYDVIVIGAGCGGLSAASILASQGRKVLVLEQSDRVGGCCSTFEKDSFYFDVGASIVEEIQPTEIAFEMLGTKLSDEVDLVPVDPMMIQIPLAFQRCGEKFGMETRTGSRVIQVLLRNGRAAGVLLDDGAEITSGIVVSDINAIKLYLEMIGEQQLPWLARVGMKSYEYSKSVPMVYVGLDGRPELEAHHSIIAVSLEEVNDYWWNNLKKGRLPKRTFGLICWPTLSDQALAPEGHHALNLIPEGFYHLEGTDWDTEKQGFIERTIDDLDSYAIPGLKEHVVVSDAATPLDFERRLLMPEGAIYDIQEDFTEQAIFRPSARSRSVKGLYLVGNSTHPGGGVPAVIASGIIASKLIDRYE